MLWGKQKRKEKREQGAGKIEKRREEREEGVH
jgi:hypothetical protein